MEWVWLPNGKEENAILTHALFAHYSAPSGFNMYMTGDDAPFLIDKTNEDYNAPERATELIAKIEERIEHYATDDIFVVFGDDFKYINAHWMFTNLDNMIKYMNMKHGDRYHFRYSTPSDYVDALAKKNHEWPVKTDDMFPYSAGTHDFWTGYFTSRANAKEYVRRTSSANDAASLLHSMNVIDQKASKKEKDASLEANKKMMDAIGILTHHDAVAGTAKQAVADDYNRIMYEANEQNFKEYGKLIG